MEKQLNELTEFLKATVNNYPPLPKATNIEERIDKAVAYREILSDYNLKATYKIKELFASANINTCKNQIQQIAAECLHSYHKLHSS